MGIHHAVVKRAQKHGIILSEEGDMFEAHWPKMNQRVKGESAKDALDTMIEIQQGVEDGKLMVVPDNPFGAKEEGRKAYEDGIAAADCPYGTEDVGDHEYQKFLDWNEGWDEAADENEDESPGGSVVKEKYRIKYAELGHPTHCGDWLAELLNNYCIGDKNTDLEVFEDICAMNDVDTSKYKRTGTGWQGRIRMTGRNLLAKRVFLNGGKIKTPEGNKKAPGDWMEAQRYKKTKAKKEKK